MGKHLGLKASILLIVIFFHTFVLVPIAYCGTVVDMAAARTVFRAVAPSVVKSTAAGGGVGFLIGVAIQAGMIYIAIKPSALTKLASWLSTNVETPVGNGSDNFGSHGTWHTHIYQHATAGWRYQDGSGATNDWVAPQPWENSGHCANPVGIGGGGSSFEALWQQVWGSSAPGVPPPTIPTDYGDQILPENFDGFDFGDYYITPSGGGALTGAEPIVSVTQMTAADLDKSIGAMGMTSPDPATGDQPDNGPTPNDNTVTSGDSTIIGYLRGIYMYVSNLVGIKADTARIANSMDNVSGAIGSQTNATNQMKAALDNAVVAINTQTEIDNAILTKTDNVIQSIESLKTKTATESTISSRIAEVRDILATKFPFSFIVAVADPGATTGGTYPIPDIQMPMGHSISVDPMQNAPIAAAIGFVRGLVAIGMWAIFVIYIIRKAVD